MINDAKLVELYFASGTLIEKALREGLSPRSLKSQWGRLRREGLLHNYRHRRNAREASALPADDFDGRPSSVDSGNNDPLLQRLQKYHGNA
jgi:hypothetical protein